MSEFVLHVEKLFEALRDPEYRFLLLEPLIIFGIGFGLIIFLVSYFLKAPKVQMAALIFIGLSSMAHVPYLNARNEAQPRIEQVYKVSSPSRVKEFKENTISWRKDSRLYLLLAAIAGAAALFGTAQRTGVILSVATIVFSLIAVKSALWMHYQDSLAYHPNLKTHQVPIDSRKKYAPPPAKRAAEPKPKPTVTDAPARSATRVAQPAVPSSTALASPAPQKKTYGVPKPRTPVSTTPEYAPSRLPTPEPTSVPRPRFVQPVQN